MKAKEVAERFANMNPESEVWITYITKDDIAETFSECEYTDENDNLIDTEPYVTEAVVKEIVDNLDNDDFLWERFNENYSDTCREVLARLIDEDKEDRELWDIPATKITGETHDNN